MAEPGLKCNNEKIENHRENFIINVTGILKEFKKIDKIHIIKYCISMSDPIIQNITAKYIEDLFVNFESEEKKLIK